MRLSVRALRRARPELFVNYISSAFIAPEPRATEKPPPPPQTESRAPGAPASRRPGCGGDASPEVSGSPTRDLESEKGGGSPNKGGTWPRRGSGKYKSPGGPGSTHCGLCQAEIKNPEPPSPDPCPSPPALGHAPGEREPEALLDWRAGGQSQLHSPGWATRDRGGDSSGWGRGPVRGLSLPHARRRREELVALSASTPA